METREGHTTAGIVTASQPPTGNRKGSVSGLRRLRPWQATGGVLVAGMACLLSYAYWPALTGEVVANRPASRPSAPSVIQVDGFVVEPADLPLYAEATGHLVPWRRAEISSEAEGIVVERLVEEGQFVEAGALLLKLDDRAQRIELLEAEADLLKARAEYAVSGRYEAAPRQADTTLLAQARARFAEARKAYGEGLLTPEALREAERRLEAAELLTGRDRAGVQAVTTGLAQAEQRLARARLAYERTRIVAPFPGRVADVKSELGQRIGVGQNVLTLLDDRSMKVDVEVLEQDVVRLSNGAVARVRLPALGDLEVRGTIHSINPSIDPGTGTGRVTVVVSNPQHRLVSGLFASVHLETDRLSGRLVVPAEAVLVRQGRDVLFRIVDGRAQWIYVTVGARSRDLVEITDGIHSGDTIATAGHFALAHDTPVAVVHRPLP